MNIGGLCCFRGDDYAEVVEAVQVREGTAKGVGRDRVLPKTSCDYVLKGWLALVVAMV